MRRIQYHRYGGPEVLRLEEVQPARPGPGEVLVRVGAAGVNPMDIGIHLGRVKSLTGRKFPRGLGHDFSGVVEAAGDGVTRLRPGDEVLGVTSLKAAGAFADMVVAKETDVVHKPANVSWEHAATLGIAGGTAYQGLKRAKLRSGQAVFVTGVLGAVGRSVAQIAMAAGATVSGSCRESAWQDAYDLGVSPVVGFDFDFDAQELRGRFDIVFDTSGKLPIATSRTLLKSGGRIIDIVPAPAKFVRSALSRSYQVVMGKSNQQDTEEIARLAGEGVLRPLISQTVPLDEAIPALTELERNRKPGTGKLVFTMMS
ncbi:MULTISPECIES: NADP-dependent oxidoreductase [unclassified Streptomyces]|nr:MULTISPECIES: NADP-dependent oxidoreductase [unclassified Streptomyces]